MEVLAHHVTCPADANGSVSKIVGSNALHSMKARLLMVRYKYSVRRDDIG